MSVHHSPASEPAPIRRALVTGGSGDIGGAICRELAAAGLFVYVHANTGVARAEELAHALRAAGGQAQAVAFDLADAAATRAAVETLLAHGPIQVLVNNAGVHANTGVAVAAARAHSQDAGGGAAWPVAFDLADAAATRAAVETLLAHGPIQVLVHNAGVHDDAPIAGMRREQWHRVLDVSLHG